MKTSSARIERDDERSVALLHPDGRVRAWEDIHPMAFGPNYPDEASQRQFLEDLAHLELPESNPTYGSGMGQVLHRCFS